MLIKAAAAAVATASRELHPLPARRSAHRWQHPRHGVCGGHVQYFGRHERQSDNGPNDDRHRDDCDADDAREPLCVGAIASRPAAASLSPDGRITAGPNRPVSRGARNEAQMMAPVGANRMAPAVAADHPGTFCRYGGGGQRGGAGTGEGEHDGVGCHAGPVVHKVGGTAGPNAVTSS